MAIETEQLVVQLEARVTQFERAFQRANKTASDSWQRMERRGKQAETNINRSFTSVGQQAMGLGRTLGVGLGAAAAIEGARRLIDASVRIDNALKVAGLSGTELTAVYDKLFQSAQNNAAPLESLVQLYGRAAQVQKELGVSTSDLLKFTDNVAVALRVSGRSAQESSGALLQLSQALGAGTVRAEEFNSMLEGALPIVQAAARGIVEAGGSVSKLKTLVNEGKVSSEAFFRGFQQGAYTLNQQVSGATLTAAAGFERLQNSAIDAARRVNEAAGVSKTAASVLDGLAAIVTKLGDGFVWLSKASGESGAVKGINELGAAAKLLWTSPSFQNLYRFLFDPSGSSDALAANDAISAKIRGFKALGDAMRAANAEADKTKKADSKTPSRFDEAHAAFTPKPISLKDYKPKEDKKGDSAERDAFDRSMSMVSRQTALLGAEISTIGQSVAARERQRVVVEMETAARRANEQAGLKNTEVTEQQRQKINQLADAYASARERLEALNGPLATFARESANVGQQLENVAVQSLDRMGDELSDVIMGTKSAADAFRSMTNIILAEIVKIAIRQAILAPLAGLMGGGGAGGILGGIGSLFSGGVRAATGGEIRGPGTGTSDSIPAALSNGEFVVNARATAQHRQLLHAINSGRVQRYAEGGPVGSSSDGGMAAPLGISANPITVNSTMTFNFPPGTQPSQLDRNNASAFGAEAEAAMIRVLKKEARTAAAAEIRTQLRPGGILK